MSGGQIVELGENRGRGVVLLRDGGERLVRGDRMRLVAHALLGRQGLQRRLEGIGVIDRHQHAVRSVRIAGPAVEAGIQRHQLVVARARQLRGDGELQLRLRVDHGEVRLVRYRREVDTIALWLGHQALEREELGHVGAGLGRQVQVPEVARQPCARL